MKILLFLSFLFSFNVSKAQFIRVSSNLWDAGTQQEKKVEGVGSLIMANDKFYVLTVGHVSLGSNVQLIGDQGSTFQPLDRFDDFQNDISLIQVDPTEKEILTYILAVYGVHPDVKGKALITGISNSYKSQSDTGWMINLRTMQGYRSHILDFQNLVEWVPRKYDEITISPAKILIAPWLPRFNMNEWSQLVERHALKWKTVSSSSDIKNHEIQIPFVRGYSGSPMVVHHGATMMSASSLYTVGGIFTLSNSDTKISSSHAVGPGTLHAFIENAIHNRKDSAQPPTWFLLNDLFARVAQDLVVYRYDGPIGNGIAPVGKVVQKIDFKANGVKSDAFQALQNRMQNAAKANDKSEYMQANLDELSTILQNSANEVDQAKIKELSRKLQMQIRLK